MPKRRYEKYLANTPLADGELALLSKAECDRWARQLEPYVEKQLSSFGDLGQKVKKIAEDMNKKFPYKPDKGIM